VAAGTSRIPAARFTSADFFELERVAFWPRAWAVVGRDDEVRGPGQYFTWEHTGVPLIIVGGVDGQVRVFYNSCRHRGAPVVREPRGRSRALRCQYHSWTYDTTGRLVSVPDERDFVDLRLEERGLVPVQVALRDGWLLTNQAEHAPGPPAVPAPAPGERVLLRLVRSVPGNWKFAAAALRDHAMATGGTFVLSNAAFPVPGSGEPVMFAWPQTWPFDHASCRVEAVFLAPDWDEDDPPLESPETAARVAGWEARLASLSAAVTSMQRAAESGQVPASESLDVVNRAVDAVMGDDLPQELRVL
jgi:phenylpropionate dioxygenase-like ring-hydroxylating dioxygenase large terminal subunit